MSVGRRAKVSRSLSAPRSRTSQGRQSAGSRHSRPIAGHTWETNWAADFTGALAEAAGRLARTACLAVRPGRHLRSGAACVFSESGVSGVGRYAEWKPY
jgi:hypothetical protein